MLDWSGRRSDDGDLEDAIAGKPCSYVWTRPPLSTRFSNTATRLHLCIRPIRGSCLQLLANIG